MTETVEVWVDADFLELTRVGTLSHDRGTLRFAYEPTWLKSPQAFALDPHLSLGEGTYFPNAEAGNFRVFDDSAPDRWGQTLMKRREALSAKDEGRKPRTLYAWDFLLGVEDVSRQGALRYRRAGEGAFLAHETLTVPPVASLKELEVVAREITAKRIDDLAALRQWLKVLVAPGASLGGARPKASFTETNGSLWIAKFPAREDTRDVGAWEALAQRLAARAGINVPASELRRFSGEHHTFCVQRFDRSGVQRRFYASAMALLRKDQSESTSYLELAEFLHARGAKDHIASDLEQLFRRVRCRAPSPGRPRRPCRRSASRSRYRESRSPRGLALFGLALDDDPVVQWTDVRGTPYIIELKGIYRSIWHSAKFQEWARSSEGKSKPPPS